MRAKRANERKNAQTRAKQTKQHKQFNTQQKQMKKQYKEPQIYIENVVVESGIAVSPKWGDAGYAGYWEEGEDNVDEFGDF